MLLSLDVGTKIIGIARSDSEERFVFPVGSYSRAQNTAQMALLQIIEREKPRLIVVGLPLDAQGAGTVAGEGIKAFCQRISKRSEVPIVYFDESYTTEDVKERLNLNDEVSYREAKEAGRIDAAAAAIILERFLEAGHGKPA